MRAGISNDAESYRWTSCALYCRNKPVESFVDPGPVLQLVHEDQSQARKKYKQILQKAIGVEPDNALEHQGAIEKFCIRLSEIFPKLFQRLGKKTANNNDSSPCLLELTELERRLVEINKAPVRSESGKKARRFIVEQLLARGYKKTEIAERMGISLRSVFNIINS